MNWQPREAGRDLEQRLAARSAPEIQATRDAFVAELATALGADWPTRLAAQSPGLFAQTARDVIDLYRRRLGDRQAARIREALVSGWTFLAAVERLRIAVEEGRSDEIVAAARWVVSR